MKCALTVLVCACLTAGGLGQQSPASSATGAAATQRLPLTRVILYKSGVGYFEFAGSVTGNQDVEINLTSAQLNDVLKSLTAIDLNGGRVSGASYNSNAAGQSASTLSAPIARGNTLTALLENLRGAQIEVRTAAGAFTGRLLNAEDKETHSTTGTTSLPSVSLMSDSGANAGEVRTFTIDSSASLRFTDRALEQELARALGLLDATHAQDTRRLVLTATGTGARQLRVSYISEVPVWKSTYRIVIPEAVGAKPLLQGWAVVDNTIGEDWLDVNLALASGAPQSFIEQLSQPLYARRPVVALPQGYLPSPQLHAASDLPEDGRTVEVQAGQPIMAASLGFGGGSGGGGRGAVASGFALGGDGTTDGNAAYTARLGAPAPPALTSQSFQSLQSRAATVVPADAGALGELYQYALKDKVTIRKNQSALVPIVQAEVTADKVSLWSAVTRPAYPLRALWLTNASTLVLDGGSFSVVDADAFGGEGLMDTMQPGERRLISYATDLGLRISAAVKDDPAGITRMKVADGVLVQSEELRRHTAYTALNADTSGRAVVVEHPKPNLDWKIAAAMKPEDQSATVDRFRFNAAAKQTSVFNVREVRANDLQYPLNLMTTAQVDEFDKEHALTPELESALRGVIAGRAALDALDASIAAKEGERAQVVADQERVRANLQALVKGAPDEKTLAGRYTKTLADEENQLAALANDLATLRAQQKKAHDSQDALIQTMHFDVAVQGVAPEN